MGVKGIFSLIVALDIEGRNTMKDVQYQARTWIAINVTSTTGVSCVRARWRPTSRDSDCQWGVTLALKNKKVRRGVKWGIERR